MEHAEAVALLQDAEVQAGGTWADLGAGSGTFTLALAELLGREGTVYAVDRSRSAVRALQMLTTPGAVIVAQRGDFTEVLPLGALHGVLMANSLHFVRRQARVLRRIVEVLKPGGHLLVVEYEQTRGTPWVPYPVPFASFAELVREVGLEAPRRIGTRRSSFGREMYAALAQKAGELYNSSG